MPRRETVKTVRAIRPNVGIEREYRRRLNKLIRLMNDSVVCEETTVTLHEVG